jgi:hypothetical protein
MSEITRKQRHIGMLRRLLSVAIEQKNVSAGLGIARQIARLEGWDTSKEPEPAPIPEQAPRVDLSPLLALIQAQQGDNPSA